MFLLILKWIVCWVCRVILVPFTPKYRSKCHCGLRLRWRREGNAQFGHLNGCQLVSILIWVYFVFIRFNFFIWYFLVSYNLGPNLCSASDVLFLISCHIFFPCGLENLTKVLEGEREDRGIFQAVPFHYIEISRLLFDQWALVILFVCLIGWMLSNVTILMTTVIFVGGSARDDIPDIYMVSLKVLNLVW